MVNLAPMYDPGDLVTPLSMSIVMTFKEGVATVNKGDIVALTTTNVTDGSALGNVDEAAAGDANVIGIAMETSSGSPLVVPVIIVGVVKTTASAAAIPAGTAIEAAGATTVRRIAALPSTEADHRSLVDAVFGHAISEFGSADSGLVFVNK